MAQRKSLTNKRVIALWEQKEALHQQAKHLAREIKRLEKVLDQVEQDLRVAERVTEIYRGVPIQVEPNGRYVQLWDAQHDYHAQMYQNANVPKMWGVNIYDFVTHKWAGGRNLGCQFTKKHALVLAKNWVAKRLTPSDFVG